MKRGREADSEDDVFTKSGAETLDYVSKYLNFVLLYIIDMHLKFVLFPLIVL